MYKLEQLKYDTLVYFKNISSTELFCLLIWNDLVSIQALKLDIEFKDDKIGPADESDNMSCSSEGDVRTLRSHKLDLDYRVREQASKNLTHSS